MCVIIVNVGYIAMCFFCDKLFKIEKIMVISSKIFLELCFSDF